MLTLVCFGLAPGLTVALVLWVVATRVRIRFARFGDGKKVRTEFEIAFNDQRSQPRLPKP
jgi:hypothetical protein